MNTRQQILDAHAKKRNPMTPKELFELLELKGWKQADLAREIDVTHVTVWNWTQGKPMPYATQLLLRGWLIEAREERKSQRSALKTA